MANPGFHISLRTKFWKAWIGPGCLHLLPVYAQDHYDSFKNTTFRSCPWELCTHQSSENEFITVFISSMTAITTNTTISIRTEKAHVGSFS